MFRRRSLWLKGYDYSVTGAYFVTLCSSDRACVFGRGTSGQVPLTPVGEAQRVAQGPYRSISLGLPGCIYCDAKPRAHGLILRSGACPQRGRRSLLRGYAARGRCSRFGDGLVFDERAQHAARLRREGDNAEDAAPPRSDNWACPRRGAQRAVGLRREGQRGEGCRTCNLAPVPKPPVLE